MSGSGRPGRIRAHVIDHQTGQHIQDFKVACRYVPKQRRVLNPDGRVEWKDNLTEGNEYSFHIYSKGYSPWRGSLRATSLGKDKTLTIALSPSQPMLGRLLDANTSEPVVGASVLFGVLGDAHYFEWSDWNSYIDGHHPLTCIQRATTDRDGRFWFCEDAAEAGAIIIFAPGYERIIIRPEDRPPTGPDGRIQVVLRPEATIQGTLMENGLLRIDSNIMLWKEQPDRKLEEWFESSKTNADGRFVFNRLAPGIYHLSIEHKLSRWRSKFQSFKAIKLSPSEKKNLGPLSID
jgi:5-hydroxyisourate hydrolase-like protein (transthyretin family)